MELWGNGVMNSLAQHSNTPSSNTFIPPPKSSNWTSHQHLALDSTRRSGFDSASRKEDLIIWLAAFHVGTVRKVGRRGS